MGNYIVDLVWIENIKNTCHPVYVRICGGRYTQKLAQNTNKRTTQMGTTILGGQHPVVNQQE